MPNSNARKRTCVITFMILLPVVIYLAFCVSGLYQDKELSIINFQEHLEQVLLHPSLKYYNEKTLMCIGCGLLMWLVGFAYFYAQAQYNLMHGREHGTAEFGSIQNFNKRYASKIESENKILSQNVRMKYDKSTLRNNNTFVVGGSGAGKTAFFVTPNALNNHGSMVYTDPKGGARRSYLKRVGTAQI